MLHSDFLRYLTAKRSVDDRALNRTVIDALRAQLRGRATSEPLCVVELGGGVGTMIARSIEWELLRGPLRYTLSDVDAEGLVYARRFLAEWAQARGGSFAPTERGIELKLPAQAPIEVELLEADVTRPETLAGREPADLLIANALLDLVDVPSVVPALWALLRPRGLFWFSINFDGETIFMPEHPADSELLALYHRTMDERVRDGRPAGDSKTGRHLFEHLRSAGAELLAAGASDWVVHPERGSYPGDEAYFLRHIIDTVDEALRVLPATNRAALASWTAARSAQIDRGELVYIAHQLDFLGRAPR